MKAPVLIGVEGEVAAFESLFAAARERRLRFGWLELDASACLPPEWAAPLVAGAFRAVAASGGETVSVKKRKGPAILRDLLRENFLGADAVLVKGADLFPRLRLEGATWRFAESPQRERGMDLEQLLARLRKPELRWRERATGSDASAGTAGSDASAGSETSEVAKGE